MIEGVRIHTLEPHVDERGSLTELLRSDWPEYTRFGQAILTVNQPGVIRGWHWHRQQTDVIVVVAGRVLLPLYDGRPDSATRGQLEERVSEQGRRFALFVPPGVFHGYRTLGGEPATIVNFPDRTYNAAEPDEERVAFDDPAIAYEWKEPSRPLTL